MAAPDRWTPWIEGREKFSDFNVTSTTVTFLPDLVYTFTPQIDSRAHLTFSLDNKNVGAGTTDLVASLWNSSTFLKFGPVWTYGPGLRFPASHTFVIDVLANTTYTLQLGLALSAAVTTFTVFANRSRAALVTMPNLHA